MIGVAVTTHVLGRSPAEEWFVPLLKELDKRKAILYIHPEGCGIHSPLIQEHNLTWMIGAPVEDTVCIAQLIINGIPSPFPSIKIINSHLGVRFRWCFSAWITNMYGKLREHPNDPV